MAFETPEEAPLSGQVHGLKAAKGEERFARALEKRIKKGIVLSYYFRESPGIAKGAPGWNELDFEIFTIFGTIAVSIKGAGFVHKGESSRNKDKLNELLLMDRLSKIGRPVSEIKSVWDYELNSMDEVERIMRRFGL